MLRCVSQFLHTDGWKRTQSRGTLSPAGVVDLVTGDTWKKVLASRYKTGYTETFSRDRPNTIKQLAHLGIPDKS